MAKDIASLAPMHKAFQDRAAEVEHLAEGWKLSLQIHERLRRLEAGKPLLELLAKD